MVSFKLRSAEGLNFAIPINYVRGLLNNLHESLTLEQMRKSLVETTSAVQQSNGPSLKETLDWLKEKLPLAATHFVRTTSHFLGLADEMGATKDITQRTIPIRFDSCTIVFEDSEVWVWAKFLAFREIHMARNTVPLGALTGESHIFRRKDYIKDPEGPDGWVVALEATSKVILSESWHFTLGPGETDDNAKHTIKSESDNSANLSFNDESMAKRVLEAFKHAADLCRGKEAF